MPKTREQKKAILDKLQSRVDGMKSAVFVNFFGIPVKEIDQLRNKCKDQNVDYMVAKKTLLKKVLSEKGYDIATDKALDGEIGAIFGIQDEVAPAKLVSEFAKGHDKMKIVGGILEGKIINQTEVIALSKLPSKQELLAKVVGSIASPLSGFVNVLQGNIRGFVYALNAIKEKNHKI